MFQDYSFVLRKALFNHRKLSNAFKYVIFLKLKLNILKIEHVILFEWLYIV